MPQGFRALAKTPGYFALALAALALGVAAATVLFSVTESVLWRALPFADSERLALLTSRNLKAVSEGNAVSRADFRDWRARARSFTALAAMSYSESHNLSAARFGERIHSKAASANLFETLGIAPALGRVFRPEEERAPSRAAVLSDAYWRSRFDASPTVLGTTVKLDGEAYSIVGVLPAGFHLEFVDDPDLFVPLDLSGAGANRQRSELAVIGRLAPGIGLAAAAVEMHALARQLGAENPRADGNWTINVENLRVAATKYDGPVLLLFFGVAALVLLIACANVAALQLVRYTGRQREIAVRIALGANRLALLRHALAESAWIAIPGALAGSLLAAWGVEWLRKLMPAGEFVRASQIRMDPVALAFILAISCAAMLLFALAPSFTAPNLDLNDTLRGASKSIGANPRTRRRIDALIAAEIALSFLLLFAAGLFAASHQSLLNVPLGFDPHNVLAVRIAPGGDRQMTPAQSRAYYRQALEAAKNIPGVREAAISGALPLDFDSSVLFTVASRQASQDSLARVVSPGFFHLLAIPLLQGRAFTEGDSESAPRVAIVNQNFARRFFGMESPIGKSITLEPGGSPSIPPGPVQIVGLAANIKELGLDEVVFKDIYLPFAQNPSRSMYLSAKSGVDPETLIPALRGQLRAADSEASISDAAGMETRIGNGLQGNRFRLFLVSVFAALAVLLAAAGVYGAIAFSVAQRTREFGVRMALGAPPNGILLLGVMRAVRLAVAGAACGFMAALALGTVLKDALYLAPGKHSGLLFGVAIRDPKSFLAAGLIVFALAVLAALAPAARAARIDPAIALRQE
ncbi:MAG: ABC transporter permease [Bryobacteraceae bacterium]|jgi:putative ABC transport system permease protein